MTGLSCLTTIWCCWTLGLVFHMLFVVSLASEVIVVTMPKFTSLTDAYVTIKVLVGKKMPDHPHGGQPNCTPRRWQSYYHPVATRLVTAEPGREVRLIHTDDIPVD